MAMEHKPAANFDPGKALEVVLQVPAREARSLHIKLYYRHVDQAERYESVDMRPQGSRFSAEIPAEYTDSKYPLQYYFEPRRGAENAWLFPGLGDDLSSQPYFVIRAASALGV